MCFDAFGCVLMCFDVFRCVVISTDMFERGANSLTFLSHRRCALKQRPCDNSNDDDYDGFRCLSRSRRNIWGHGAYSPSYFGRLVNPIWWGTVYVTGKSRSLPTFLTCQYYLRRIKTHQNASECIKMHQNH